MDDFYWLDSAPEIVRETLEKPALIRVACIDAPEMAQAPYGQQAREALQALLPVGSTVTLKTQTKDRFGRTVAEVFAQNGANVGLLCSSNAMPLPTCSTCTSAIIGPTSIGATG